VRSRRRDECNANARNEVDSEYGTLVRGTLNFIRQSIVVGVQIHIVRDTIVVKVVRALLLIRYPIIVTILIGIVSKAIQVCVFCAFHGVRYAWMVEKGRG